MSTTSLLETIIMLTKGEPMSLISQNAIPEVTMAFMNPVHKQDVDIINHLFDLI